MTDPNQSMPPTSPMSPKEAKAQAAAAKAYAKGQRNWFMRHKFLSAFGALIVIVIIAVATGSGGSKTNDASDATSTTGSQASQAPKATKAATSGDSGTATFPMQDGDWRLDSVRLKNDGLGDFGGTGRITYTGDDSGGGNNTFTLTIFKGGKEIAALNGSATDVKPATTVTVQWVSSDKFASGPYTYDFQNDF
jgi:hypothetical protein